MAQPTAPRIAADPTRQAVPSLAGYVYQVWHSLLEWLTLSDGEALELEGNEDIDRLRPGEATTTQVKHSDAPRSLTLRSPDAIEGVNNFWAARTRNMGIRLRFRFLSTAEAGIETGGHFERSKGIDVWRAARRGTDLASDQRRAGQIQAFLLTCDRLSDPLRAWLAAATPDQVLGELVAPFEWDLGAGGISDLRSIVEEHLILLGAPFGVFPANARKAALGLLDVVLIKATSKSDRVLKRVDLLVAFEAATSVMVPLGSLGAASARQAIVFPSVSISSAGDLTSSLAVLAAVRDGLPELPSTILPRAGIVGPCTASAATGFVHLHGSTGMGKSTIAMLVAQQMQEAPLWLDLRNAGSQGAALVRVAATHLLRMHGVRSLVLDDVAFEGDSRPVQDAVAAAGSAIMALGGTMLVTSTAELPHRLRSKLKLSGSACQHAVSGLEEAEVDELLGAHGLRDDRARQHWARLIWLQTSGHPQLVDARVQALRDRGFPSIGADDLARVPEEIAEVRSQARALIRLLPDAQRNLLYRLSLDSMPFRRDVALRIGDLPPSAAPSGDTFDGLVGPWIEHFPGKRYRVSPLTLNAGGDAHGDAWAVDMHARIADVLLSGQLNEYDVLSACAHAVLGRNSRALFRFCTAIVMHAKQFEPVAEMLDLLVLVDPDGGAEPLAATREQRAMLRLAQFEIAVHRGEEETVLKAAAAVDAATRLTPESSEGDRLLRVMAFSKMLIRTKAPLTPEFIVRAVAELSEIQAGTDMVRDLATQLHPGIMVGMSGPFNLGWLLTLFLPGRLKTAANLNALWAALDALDPDRRDTLLSPLSADASMGPFLIDAVWLAEMRSERPNWTALVKTLRDGLDCALRWRAMGLATAVATTTVRTLNENLQSPREAFAFGRSAVRRVGWDARLIDAIADVCDWTSRFRTAHRLRRRVIAAWLPSKFDRLGPAIARRKAGRSAAKAGDWQSARGYLEDAASSLKGEQGHDVFRAGLLADAGHAAARAGDKPGAIELLSDSLILLRQISNDPGQPRAFRLHKLFGNLVAWLVGGNRVGPDGHGVWEQPPATCSDFEIAKELTDLPVTPLELTTLQLCQYAGDLLPRFPDLMASLDSLRESSLVVVRMFSSQLDVKIAVSKGDMSRIVRAAVRCARELTHGASYRDAENVLELRVPTPISQAVPDKAVDELLKKPILSCLARQVEQARSVAVPPDWLKGVNQSGLSPELRRWLQLVSAVDAMSLPERWTAFINARDAREPSTSVLYAIGLADESVAQTGQLLQVHINLFQALRIAALEKAITASASRIVTRQWAEIAKQTFRLRYPHFSVPMLEEALNFEPDGLGKISRVLLAGLFAVGTAIPGWLDAQLKEAIGNECG
jgi:hypothetical protein